MDTPRNDREDTTIYNFLSSGVKVARYTLTGVSRKNGDFNPSFLGCRNVIGRSEEGGEVCHGSMNVIQMKRRASNLRRRELTYVIIEWRQSGGRRFTGLGVQDPGLFGASGRRRRKKGEEISCDNVSVSCHKRETNFRIEGTEDLWILKDRDMVGTEMRESKGSVCNQPMKRVKEEDWRILRESIS